jgi:hypothetical protein
VQKSTEGSYIPKAQEVRTPIHIPNARIIILRFKA